MMMHEKFLRIFVMLLLLNGELRWAAAYVNEIKSCMLLFLPFTARFSACKKSFKNFCFVLLVYDEHKQIFQKHDVVNENTQVMQFFFWLGFLREKFED